MPQTPASPIPTDSDGKHTAAPNTSDTPVLPDAAGEQARALFAGKHSLCSGAVLQALNQTLDGGLTDRQAKGLASGFGDAMGGTGCLCGAVSGGVLGLGLFLADQGDSAVRKQATKLHEEFRAEHGSTCCRVLRKKAANKRDHFDRCAERSAHAARIAARLILDSRPELAAAAGAPLPPPRPRNPVSRLLGHLFGPQGS